MKTLKKHWKWALVAAIVVLLTAIFATWRPVKYPATQAYVVGSSNCRGRVDTAQFLEKGDAFAIAADENGWAVFKIPPRPSRPCARTMARAFGSSKRSCICCPSPPIPIIPTP